MGKNVNEHFLRLVTMIASACRHELGKNRCPAKRGSGKNLPEAQKDIDLLTMFRDKTKGNLTPDEKRFVDETIADLEFMYIEADLKQKSE